MKSNPIKRILYVDGQAYYKYEHEVFEIDGCMELRKKFEERPAGSVNNSALKELVAHLEEEVGHFLK